MRNLRRRLWDSLFLALCFSCSAAAQNTLERNPTSYLFQEFNPQLVIIIVSVTVLFFSGLFFIFSRLCLTGNDQTVSDQVATIPVSISTGLDPDTIKTFPTFSYSIVKSHKLGKGSLECAVCLCEFEEEETLRLLPQCSHVFHFECIDMWLSSHTTCPVCRFNLILDYDEVNSENSQSEDQHEVAIVIDENQHQEPPERDVIDQIDRLKSAKAMRFSRSYTTGHCLIQSENCDRFTLRLPENIREELLRIKSSRSGGRRLAKFGSPTKSDPWMVGRSQGFFKRTFSFGSAPMKSPVGDPTAIVKVFITPVKTTLDCLGVKSDAVKCENEESSSLTKSAC